MLNETLAPHSGPSIVEIVMGKREMFSTQPDVIIAMHSVTLSAIAQCGSLNLSVVFTVMPLGILSGTVQRGHSLMGDIPCIGKSGYQTQTGGAMHRHHRGLLPEHGMRAPVR